MDKKKSRAYKKHGLEFLNMDFTSQSEKKYVKSHTERIAKKIREKRAEKKLTQEKLAEICSVSLSTVKFIEQGQRAPSLPMLLKIMFVLDKKTILWD